MEGLDPNGIQTNCWRESEWCLFPDEDLATVERNIASSEWSHLSVVRTGFAIHLMEPHLSKMKQDLEQLANLLFNVYTNLKITVIGLGDYESVDILQKIDGIIGIRARHPSRWLIQKQ